MTKITGLPELPRCRNDPESLVTALRPMISNEEELEARTLTDPTRSEVLDDLEWLFSTGDANALFYFSGHAVRSRTGRAALVLADSNSRQPGSLISGAELGEAASHSAADEVVVLLDCCFAEDLATQIVQSLDPYGPSLTALVASASGVLARAADAQLENETDTLSAKLSPFTRSLVLALGGIGLVDPFGQFSLDHPFTVSRREAIRRDGVPPSILRRGTAPGIGLKLAQPTLWPTEPALVRRRSSRANPQMILIGNQGTRAVEYAANSLLTNHFELINSRSRISIAMDTVDTGRSEEQFSLYAGVGNPDLLQELIDNPRVNSILTTIVPASTGERVLDLVPAVDEDEFLYLVGDRPDLRKLVENSFESLRAFSADSIEAARLAVNVLAKRQVAVDSPDGLTAAATDALTVLSARVHARQIWAALAAVTDCFISVDALEEWATDGSSEDRRQFRESLRQMGQVGALDVRGEWVRLLGSIKERLSGVMGPADAEGFLNFVSLSLRTSRANRLSQSYRALGTFTEDAIARRDVTGLLVDTLAEHGRGFLLFAGPRASARLFSSVIAAGPDAISEIRLHLGDAHRLGDNYEQAAQSFREVQAQAQDPVTRLLSQAGLASAQKNSIVAREQLESVSARLLSVSTTDSTEPRGLGLPNAARRVTALAKFQRGNIQFASSEWNSAFESYVAAAELIGSTNDVQLVTLLIDVLKGQGDVLLHRGAVHEASDIATRMLDLAWSVGLPVIDARGHAKLMQYVGDVCRHASHVSARQVSRERVRTAEGWYSASVDCYSRLDLVLGRLISTFRLQQCAMLRGELTPCLSEFLALRDEFGRIGNPLWAFKASVMALLCGSLASVTGGGPILADALETVTEAGSRGGMSQYQQAWAEVALAGHVGGSLDRAIQLFRAIGAEAVAHALEQQGPDLWLGAHY